MNHTKTSYELWSRRPPTVKYFTIFRSKLFGSRCYIERDEEYLDKFDGRADEGIFLEYFTNNKAYRCYNKRLQKTVESTNVKDF